jgi:hypothetical protein
VLNCTIYYKCRLAKQRANTEATGTSQKRMLSIGSIFKGFTEAKSMEINRNKQVKKKEFTELNHSIFYTSLWTNEQMVVIFRHKNKRT